MSGQVVQITINVTDGNAAEAVQQVVAQLNAIGPAGEAAGAAAGAGLNQVGDHALSSREQVRLMSEEIGVHVPRAMQSVIASSQMMSAAIGAISPALIGLGAVDLLMHLGEAIYGAYEKYVLLNGVIADSDTVIKSFGDSAEAAWNRASSAAEEYIRKTQGAEAADQFKLNRLQNTGIGIPQYQSDQFKNLPDQVKGDFEKITGESIMPKDLPDVIAKVVAYEEGLAGVLDKMKAIRSAQVDASGAAPGVDSTGIIDRQITEQGKKIEIGAALIKDLMAQQAAFADESKEQQAQIDADAAAKAKEAVEKEKQKQDEILSLQNSARNAQLSGMALLEAQQEEAIDSFVKKYGTSRAAIDAIDTAYAMKEIALWKQQWDEADKAMRAAQQAAQQQAHTGAGSIENERQNALSDINGKSLDAPGAAGQLRAAANLKANTEILAAQKEFEEQMDQIGSHADDQQAQGYARIADEAAQSVRKIQSDWQALADKVGAVSAQGVDAQMEAAAAILAVNQDMFRQMQQLHQRTMEEIGKEEEQTARFSLSEWQQTQLRIIDDYQDRVRKIQDAEAQQNAALNADMQAHSERFAMDQQAEVMNAKDADAQMLAARQLMNAQMQQADEETRDKLAAGLQSLFSHPEQFFEKRAMDTAFQLMANEMLSVFKSSSPAGGILQYMFGMGPQMSTSTNPLTAMESALGMGGHHGASSALSSAMNPALTTFQQGSTTLLTGAQALMSAASSLQSAAATMSASGGVGTGLGGGGGMGGGSSIFGGAGVSTSSGAGLDMSSAGGGGGDLASAMMMPGLSSGGGSPLVSSVFDNSMMMPGLNGVAAQGAAANANAAASGTPNTGAAGLSAAMGMAGGALMAGTSIYSAYENSNPIAGAVGGAMGGMEAGAALGSIVPGIGTVVGAVGGALIGGITGLLAGIFGDQGRSQAESLDVNTIQPALTADMQDYEAGRSGYNTLASQLNSMLISAQNQTQQMGSGARSYFSSNIQPEIQAVLSSLQKQEIGGRSQITLSAAQYHDGGWTGDFGDMATSPTEGFVHAMANEFIVNPMAAAAHAPILQAMNAGTNFGYANSVQPRMPATASSGPGVALTVQAMDSKSVAQWAAAGGGVALMAALNRANGQYGGKGRG